MVGPTAENINDDLRVHRDDARISWRRLLLGRFTWKGLFISAILYFAVVAGLVILNNYLKQGTVTIAIMAILAFACGMLSRMISDRVALLEDRSKFMTMKIKSLELLKNIDEEIAAVEATAHGDSRARRLEEIKVKMRLVEEIHGEMSGKFAHYYLSKTKPSSSLRAELSRELDDEEVRRRAARLAYGLAVEKTSKPLLKVFASLDKVIATAMKGSSGGKS